PACSPHSISPFFCTHPSPPDIYTLSLHDALPICRSAQIFIVVPVIGIDRLHSANLGFCMSFPHFIRSRCRAKKPCSKERHSASQDRKSTRLNSSHRTISYAVFCLKKKKKKNYRTY